MSEGDTPDEQEPCTGRPSTSMQAARRELATLTAALTPKERAQRPRTDERDEDDRLR